MVALQYSHAQLQALRKSPLVSKPDGLPQIDQWLDITPDTTQRRTRTQAIPRVDENENPTRRPFLEQRHSSRQSHTNDGEDVFLGPKISFASASAARQPVRSLVNDDRTTSLQAEEPKVTRVPDPRDRDYRSRDSRDKEHERTTGQGYTNGYKDRYDARSKARARGDQEGDDEEPRINWSRARAPQEKDEEDRDSGARRNGTGRSKFEQSWIRDPVPAKDGEDSREPPAERSWRDKDRADGRSWTKPQKSEQTPGWMGEEDAFGEGDMLSHTQEDFQKWKDRMKAGSSATDDKPAPVSNKAAEYNFGALESSASNSQEPDPSISLFGALGDGKADEKKGDNKTSRMKTSRFTNLFASQKQESPSAETISAEPVIETSSPTRPVGAEGPAGLPIKTSSADQEGFQRMMAMLRFGGNTSANVGSPGGPMSPPDSATSQMLGSSVVTHARHEPHIGSADVFPQRQHPDRGDFVSPPPNRAQQSHPPPQPQRRPSPSTARPEAQSRDSEFLLKLMQVPRAPFADSQIYGQTYNRKDSPDISQLLNSITPKPHNQPRAPPPGFYNGPFQGHPDIQSRPLAENLARRDVGNFNEPTDQVPPSLPRDDYQRQQQQHEAQFRLSQPPTHFDIHAGPPPPFPGARPPIPQNQHDFVPPPPGFSSQRPPAPPGFFPFPGAGSAAGPPVQLGPSAGHMHAPQPGRGPAPQPAGFFAPPGFPSMNQPPNGGGIPQQRLPPQMQGYEIYGAPDAARRGHREARPQGQPQGQVQQQQVRSQQQQQQQHMQYMKQNAGGPGGLYPGA